MLEIQNHTPYEAGLAPATDKDGYDHAVCVVKATFSLGRQTDDLSLAEEQVPVVYADEHHGEPGESSVRYEMDTCLTKRGTDVILNGAAIPPRPATRMDVALQIGSSRKVVRVVGDRHWQRSMGVWKSSDPQSFTEMPLVWERAFGGFDESHKKAEKHSLETRNPVGTGFASGRNKDRLEGLALPNLEDPENLIKSWKDKPPPVGFGFVARHWQPRAGYGGTFDQEWEKERMPLLPEDFDDRYFSGAPRGQMVRGYLKGGEELRVINMLPDREVKFRLPVKTIQVKSWLKGESSTCRPNLDTVIIEPNDNRLIMVWRATIPCPRQFLYIDCVRVSEET